MDDNIFDRAYIIELTTVTLNENDNKRSLSTSSRVDRVVLKKSRLEPNESAMTFLNEIRAIRKLLSPNIVKYVGIYMMTKDEYLVVTELGNQGDLATYLGGNRDSLTFEQRLQLGRNICNGVKALHAEGMVHGDLHSHNVIIHLNNIGQVIPKLTDFGQRRFQTLDDTKIRRRLPYIAPELLNDSEYPADTRSDIYGVGVLLWEISTCKRPFDNEPLDQLNSDIIYGKREVVDPNTPSKYSTLYTECWNSKPESRPCIKHCLTELNAVSHSPFGFRCHI